MMRYRFLLNVSLVTWSLIVQLLLVDKCHPRQYTARSDEDDGGEEMEVVTHWTQDPASSGDDQDYTSPEPEESESEPDEQEVEQPDQTDIMEMMKQVMSDSQLSPVTVKYEVGDPPEAAAAGDSDGDASAEEIIKVVHEPEPEKFVILSEPEPEPEVVLVEKKKMECKPKCKCKKEKVCKPKKCKEKKCKKTCKEKPKCKCKKECKFCFLQEESIEILSKLY